MSDSLLISEEERRAQKLLAAKKKLKSFRASRHHSPTVSTVTVSGSSNSSRKRSTRSPNLSISISNMPASSFAAPLSSSTADNTRPGAHSRQSSKSRPDDAGSSSKPTATAVAGHRHRRSNSNAAAMIPSIGAPAATVPSHRRQKSSVSGSHSHSRSLARASVVGLFDIPPEQMALGAGGIVPPREIITTPATPSMDSPHIGEERDIYPQTTFGGEEEAAVKARMSTFSFGAKLDRSASPASSSRRPHPFASSHHSPTDSASASFYASPKSSSGPMEANRFSSPIPRPPSVLLTTASPSWLGIASEPSRHSIPGGAPSPSSSPAPGTPQRKRHSHNRSESISMSNLKLGRSSLTVSASPGGLGTPNSPSSPAPDGRSRLSGPPINGTRLKFEPSGRGAEADKEKDEYRRRALEKLTGVVVRESAPAQEIALPEFEDDDVGSLESSSSSSRPLSGINAVSPLLAQPSSSSPLSASPLPWSEDATINSWSGFPKSSLESDVPSFSPDTASIPLPTTRASLGVVTEEDETEADHDRSPSPRAKAKTPASREPIEPPTSASSDEHVSRPSSAEDEDDGPVGPTASRLKQLHLVSGSNSRRNSTDGMSSGLRSFALPNTAVTQKAYGTIGRGRPRPLSGLASTSTSTIASAVTASSMSSPATATIATPRSVSSAHGNGNATGALNSTARRIVRPSSISYRKEGESMSGVVSNSSRDWTGSIGSRAGMTSPTFDVASPTSASSAKLSWTSGPRPAGVANNTRPCPRPRSLVGLGFGASAASNRILNEVNEVDEDDRDRNGYKLPLAGPTAKVVYDEEGDEVAPALVDIDHHRHRLASGVDSWATSRERLDLEMERDALKDDVELWRQRCKTLEERLEAERKESALLRDRVRKLGDRLLTVSAANPAPARASAGDQESRLVGEMRAQLLALSASLERERQGRMNAQARLVEYEASSAATAASGSESPPSSLVRMQPVKFQPSLPSALLAKPGLLPSPPLVERHLAPPASPSPAPTTPSSGPLLSPALVSPNSDASGRMRTWGFPRGPVEGTTSRENKRESFFGLSATPRPYSYVENPQGETSARSGRTEGRGAEVAQGGSEFGPSGVDLPPFVVDESMKQFIGAARIVSDPVSKHSSLDQDQGTFRSVSAPKSQEVYSLDSTDAHELSAPMGLGGSASGSALSFITGYLGRSVHVPSASTAASGEIGTGGTRVPGGALGKGGSERWGMMVATGSHPHRVDFGHGCKSCKGEIIEL